MRIAILSEYYPDPSDPASGVYVHIRVAAYRRAGHEVRVYRVQPSAPRAIEYEGVPVLIADASTVRANCEAFGPQVIALHTPHPSSLHAQLAEMLPTPRVVWIHGYEAMITALHGYHRGLGRILSVTHDARKLWRLRRSLAGAAAIVYVSNWMRRTAERSMLFRHPVTRVIPNPVDTDRFRPIQQPRTSGRLRGLALRGLRAKYGLDLAVTAFAGQGATELTIVGTGPDAARLKALIEKSGAPVSLEERAIPHAEVPTFMNGFDYFVAPARTEAQGVAMCEAMACGLPVVACRAGGIPEFVRHGEGGLLVRSGSPSELRRAVLELVSDPERAQAMGLRAREDIAHKCAASQVIPHEVEILAGVVG
jgi:glycosyltransferase involved in cell wall biosynthesis